MKSINQEYAVTLESLWPYRSHGASWTVINKQYFTSLQEARQEAVGLMQFIDEGERVSLLNLNPKKPPRSAINVSN